VIVKSSDSSNLAVTYDPEQFDVELEEINVEDKKISGNWGGTLYRLHFNMRAPAEKGNHRFVID
jgi:hypothetical protein